MNALSRTLAALALVCAAVAGAVALTAPSAEAVGDCTPGADWGTLRNDLAAETVSLVNSYRATLGLRPLVAASALQASAVWKARHMARYSYMAHPDPAPPVARTAAERMAACGVTGGWGENIAAGYPSPSSVVQAWLASPGHRANIENPSFVAIGSSAAASASGAIYWAHVFGTSTGGAAPPPPATPAPAPAPTPPPPTATPPASAPPPAPAPTTAPARAAASAPAAIVLQGLTVNPRRPVAGRVLASTVKVLKRGVRMRRGHAFCSARLDGRRLQVVTRRLRRGVAFCAWRLPSSAEGKIVSAAIIVQQGRVQVDAPFRAAIS